MVTTSHACRRLVASLQGSVAARASIWLLAATLASCSGVGDEQVGDKERVSSVAQALDTDSDGMDDAWETAYFGSLSQTAAGDFDSDGMTNGEEYSYGFIPNIDDAFDDADGDRYPNVFEVRRSSDPNSSSSLPTANYTVNSAGGGTHTTIGAAVSAANVSNGAFQIIGIAAGTYKGNANLRDVTVASTKPKILFIGLDGASKTIIDGEGITNNWGWTLQNSAVVSSLTIQKATNGAFVDGSAKRCASSMSSCATTSVRATRVAST